MTKPKTPTLASLAKRKGFKASVGDSWVELKIGEHHSFLDLYFGKPAEPTREQAIAMIHAALEVLPDVRMPR